MENRAAPGLLADPAPAVMARQIADRLADPGELAARACTVGSSLKPFRLKNSWRAASKACSWRA